MGAAARSGADLAACSAAAPLADLRWRERKPPLAEFHRGHRCTRETGHGAGRPEIEGVANRWASAKPVSAQFRLSGWPFLYLSRSHRLDYLPSAGAVMPRKTDRLYTTHSEHSGAFGQHTAGSSGHTQAKSADAQYQPLPFSSCAISLQPWKNPVCDREDGTIYELTNVLPWLKKHGSSPASGRPLKAADLLSLQFHKNEATGVWHDPVSYKPFNDSTHLVAISTSGNVFAYDTVQQLNIKAKYWSDLLTGETFTRKDLITLQDPNNVSGKSVNNLHHLRQGLTLTAADKGGQEDSSEVNLKATGSASSVLKQLKAKKEKEKEANDESSKAAEEKMKAAGRINGSGESSGAPGGSSSSTQASTSKLQPYNAGIGSSGRTAASFTSTALTPRTKIETELIDEEDIMFDEIRKPLKGGQGASGAGSSGGPQKGYVRLTTNFGPLNLELHCDKAPKTCYNFLSLCRKGFYTDTVFHRNIPGFMVQGGDPSGTGRGGESIWGKPFADELTAPGAYRHTSRGCLSMANRGVDTNGSQFFLLYGPKPHLDAKHTVFGGLVDGEGGASSSTLDALERVPTDRATDKPLRSIRILDVQIYADPFQAYRDRLQAKLHRNDADEVAKREEKRRKREGDRTTWLGTRLDATDAADAPATAVGARRPGDSATGAAVGKYLQSAAKASAAMPVPVPTSAAAPATTLAPNDKKRKGGFGDFAAW